MASPVGAEPGHTGVSRGRLEQMVHMIQGTEAGAASTVPAPPSWALFLQTILVPEPLESRSFCCCLDSLLSWVQCQVI